MTKPVTMQDEDTGQQVTMSILIDNTCPINLLGRDALTAFHLAFVPTDTGMKCVPAQTEAVVQRRDEPHYYWTLDVEIGGATQLLARLTPSRSTELEKQTPEHVHCTVWFKETPGPNPDYDDCLRKLKKTGLRITK